MSVESAETGDPTAIAMADGPTPPYASFASLSKQFDRIRDEGVPRVIDASFFPGVSGSAQAQFRGSFKFLDLIDEDMKPTDNMRLLAEAKTDDERRELLKELGEQGYADLIALGTHNGTQKELQDAFRARGIRGADTLQKCVTFYLNYAEYVGYPLSPYFKRGRASNGSAAARKPRRRAPNTSAELRPAGIVNEASASAPDDQKAAYVSMLMKLAERSAEAGEINTDLLDRIEGALGMSRPQPTSPD